MPDASPIRRAIEIAGSQSKLAETSRLSQQLISKLLTGARKITAANAIAVSKATGGQVTIAELAPELYDAVALEIGVHRKAEVAA